MHVVIWEVFFVIIKYKNNNILKNGEKKAELENQLKIKTQLKK